MAGQCTHFGGKANCNIMEFAIDNDDDVKYLPTTKSFGAGEFSDLTHYAPIGSIAISGNQGNTKVFMLFSDGWFEL